MKKKRGEGIIFHIGIHKTGTTWLQECVFPNIEGITYKYKNGIQDCYYLNPEEGETILVSNEELSRSMPNRKRQLQHIIALAIQYPGAKVIIGIRDYKSWFKSCYAQLIKTGSTLTFEQFKRNI